MAVLSSHHYSSSSSSVRSSSILFRSSSPTTPVSITGKSSPPARFQIDHKPIPPSQSPNHQISISSNHHQKKACMCSPTMPRGSIRCSLHKNTHSGVDNQKDIKSSSRSNNNSPNFRRYAMTNSLARIGGVEGNDLVKKVLSSLIRPPPHQHRRRSTVRLMPSRLSVMSKAEED